MWLCGLRMCSFVLALRGLGRPLPEQCFAGCKNFGMLLATIVSYPFLHQRIPLATKEAVRLAVLPHRLLVHVTLYVMSFVAT